jgi:hypothetical protein
MRERIYLPFLFWFAPAIIAVALAMRALLAQDVVVCM